MLVLSRKVQEGFWIGQNAYVKVLSLGKRRVLLGIEAPADTTITRSELRTNGVASDEENAKVLSGRRGQL